MDGQGVRDPRVRVRGLNGGILKIAFSVWNAVVVDTMNDDSRFVDAIRQATAAAPGASALVESLLSRKRIVFANDDRLIGSYELLQKDGK